MSHQFDGWLAGLVNDRHTRDMRIRAALAAPPVEPVPFAAPVPPDILYVASVTGRYWIQPTGARPPSA